ncbi:MAG: hypothetical protein SGILL_007326 [Bacillariaceae sp.]
MTEEQQEDEYQEEQAEAEDQNDQDNNYNNGQQQQYYYNQGGDDANANGNADNANGYYQGQGNYYNNVDGQQNYDYQNGGNQQDGQEQMEEEQEAEEEEMEQEEEAAAEDDTYDPEDGVAYNTFSVCADAVIQVLDLRIYCDSPGTFYYGSGKYRNNPSCLPGDKAKIQLDYYINEENVIQQAGGYAILDISATGYSGWYQQDIQVFENADMCSSPNLKKLSHSTCPFQGQYRINSHFYWPDSQYGDNPFYPTVTVGFKSSVNANQYDYGGANTPYCRGTTFVTWTDGIRTTYANAMSNFMRSFGILLFTIAVMGGFIWFLVKKPTSAKDAGQKLGIMKRDPFADENFDFSSMPSPKQGQNLVDF